MLEGSQILITISRQLGSGGAYIGRQLARMLNIFYLDREIVRQAANQLSLSEEDLQSMDERVPTFWQSFFELKRYTSYDVYIPPEYFIPTEHDVFKVEAEMIKRIADARSAVIIGRCGSHLLRAHPNHMGIFLHAGLEFRRERVGRLYNVPQDAAAKMIAKSDRERGRYHRARTGEEWTDARQYDLSIDTGRIGVDHGLQLILKHLELLKP